MKVALLFMFLLFPFAAMRLQQPTPRVTTEEKLQPATTSDVSADSLLEIGQARKLRVPPKTPELRVISYNIRWRSGADLQKIIDVLRGNTPMSNPTIIGMQEVDRDKRRSKKTDTAKVLAEALGLYYAWAAPPTAKKGDEEETGVALLSVYPLRNVHRIVLPHEGPGHRRRAAIGASIQVGSTEMRIYSAHAETRISMDKKLDQFRALLEDLAHYDSNTPALIMGDLNTWQPDAGSKTTKLFTEAGFVTPFGGHATLATRILFVPIALRLDWIWMRGLEATGHGINQKVNVSDHWPLWATMKLPDSKN